MTKRNTDPKPKQQIESGDAVTGKPKNDSKKITLPTKKRRKLKQTSLKSLLATTQKAKKVNLKQVPKTKGSRQKTTPKKKVEFVSVKSVVPRDDKESHLGNKGRAIYLQPQDNDGNIRQDIIPPGFQCPQCPHRARSKVNLKQHLYLHNTSDGSKVFECEICAYISKNKSHFQRHMIVHNSPSETFDCNHCSYKATKKQYLVYHMLVHSTPEEVEIYTCPKCPYKTKRNHLLNDHLQLHKVKVSQSLKCKLCSYKATRKSYLVSHMLLHKTEDAYQCPECDYKARKKYNVDCHMLTHKNNTYFECYHCGYRAKRKNHLVTHLIIHNDVKAFQCDLCSYKCKRKSHLISHYETCKNKKKKEEAGERKYQCAQCSHSSFNRKQFLRHVSNHKAKLNNSDPLRLSPHV